MAGKDLLPVILLINGPNLNMLGRRSKEHYGTFTLAQVESAFSVKADALGVKPAFFQSNDEGAIITAIHESMEYAAGIVINAGAYTHYSYAILDALQLCGLPVMEVHISNIHKREPFRNISVIQPACVGQVYGLGLDSYLIGLEKLVKEHVRRKPAAESPAKMPAEPPEGPDLLELRRKIGSVDAELMEVFNRRMALAEQIGYLKTRSKASVFDAGREAEVADMARQRADSSMSSRVDAMMKTMMRLSREKQYDILLPHDQDWKIGNDLRSAGSSLAHIARAAYAGTGGSYSEQAAEKLFPNAKKVQAITFTQACDMVLAGEADTAVLPLENTTAGTVDNVYDLLQKKNLSIIRSITISVEHRLAVLPGTKFAAIRSVASHPQALSQCSEIIYQKRWGTHSSENTAFAAEEVKKRGDPSLAALCSEDAARRNGLEVLHVDVCNSSLNQTRFIAVAKELTITPDADRISTLMHLPHRSGALVGALDIFADRGLNLCSIFSRPIANTPGEYAFFLDFTCPAMGQDALLALYQLSSEMPYVKVLGWYMEE